MLKTNLHTLKDFIMEHNDYFSNGYSDVYQNSEGIIHERKPIFPNDTLGDYFYLRLPDSVKFTNVEAYRMSDCVTPNAVTGAIILVAVVKDASADVLMNNLANTLLSFPDLRLTDGIFNKEVVLLQELAKIDKPNIDAALQRLKPNTTIVSLKFELQFRFDYKKLKCIVNPCTC